jgi:GH25 family lysozyme M1 (1,4-beta-N-acetylmuramidase)
MKKLKTKYMAMAVMILGIATVSFFACRFTIGKKDSNTYGVDLSHHNYVEDWDQVTASFVYLKATEGATHQDETFKRFAHNAQKRGILVGAYHFMTTSSSNSKTSIKLQLASRWT